MDRLRYFTDMPDEPDRTMWQVWLRMHGVDPCDVAVPGWIERQEHEYRLLYEAYECDEHGRPALDPAHPYGTVRVTRVFQMEGPPLPFPDSQER